MRPVADEVLGEYEDVAREGLKALSAALAYRGSNREVYERARLGATACSNYVRLRASEANRAAVEIAAARVVTAPALPAATE